MTHDRIPKWAFAGLALIVLLGLGSAIHGAAWSQGYTMGLLAGSAADGASVLPYLISRTGSGIGVGGGFFGSFVHIGLILLLIAMVAKFIGFRRWGMHGPHGSWRHHHGWSTQGPNDGPSDDVAESDRDKPKDPTVTQM
jgi:hypothetical protein